MTDAIGPLFGTSALRREILAWFFARPEVVVHPRELARRLGRAPQVVGRELARLETAGILASETVGRARRYRVDPTSPIVPDVRSLVAKTIGVEARLRVAVEGVTGVDDAFIYGSYARGDDRPTSDIDVMVVGTVDREELSRRLVDLEQEIARDVHVTAYTRAELDALLAAGDPFLRDVFDSPRIQLLTRPGDR